jgi:excisionase family DNA binding protein
MPANPREQRQSDCQIAAINPVSARSVSRGSVAVQSGTSAQIVQPSPQRLVLTVNEAAYLLNISRAFAYELVARGDLPAIRFGRRIVIPRVAMEQVLGAAID